MERRFCFALALLLLASCDGDSPSDAGMDARTAPDTGPMEEDPIALPGLDGPVDVIVDDRGMPHIYASTVHDLMMVEGYVMARDRIVQMEFIRRGVTGRLAEVLAELSPGTVDNDMGSRFLGFRRQGRAIYESLADDDPTRLVAEAFVAGINAYIDQVVLAADYRAPDGLQLFDIMRANENFGHWEPADVFALARYQSYNLAYDADADISRTRALLAAEAAFDSEDDDFRMASRAGAFADLFSEIPARRVYTRDGFNDGTTMALLPGGGRRPRIRPEIPNLPRPPVELFDRGLRFFDRLAQNPLFTRDPHIGSNSWVVSGTHTASGNPILSNDPHLSLISPGVWWYVHLNTARMNGEDMIDAQGVAFAGLPGVVLGYNRDLAWSATTTGYDVTDVYTETVTLRNDGTVEEPSWVPVSVRFQDADVAVDTTVEELIVAGQTEPIEMPIYVVPHHGPIVPETIVGPEVVPPTGETGIGSAISVRYTGHDVSNELAFFVGLLTSTSIADAQEAQNQFRVGAQNFSFASRTGDIAWSTESRIPVREPAALSLTIDSQGRLAGYSPLFALPGEGGFEWLGDMDSRYIPHDVNPPRGYIATANQDNVGVTEDGIPSDAAHYIGGGFDPGYRQARIVERLDELIARGDITTEDMIALQGESQSSLGRVMRDPLVAALIGEGDPDAYNDEVRAAAGEDGAANNAEVIARLQAWDFSTPHAIGSNDAAEIANSVATTIFNVILTRLIPLVFNDELAAITQGPGDASLARTLERIFMSFEEQVDFPVYTVASLYPDPDTGPSYMDSVLWDEMNTEATESRRERVFTAMLEAVEWLEDHLGEDWDEWRWGRVHAVHFTQLVPAVSDPGIVQIPPVGSTEFPIGFPRHSDFGAVDVQNFSLRNTDRITPPLDAQQSGASQRVVVEMTDDGPRPFNALPGGQSENPNSPHHADEAELWRTNQQPPLYFDLEDIDAHAESRMRFVVPSR
jgi:penicillin G amidase